MIGTRVICAADGKHTYSERAAIVESHGLGRSEPVKCLPLRPRWLSALLVWYLWERLVYGRVKERQYRVGWDNGLQ